MNVKIFVRSFAFVFALTAATAFAHRADTPAANSADNAWIARHAEKVAAVADANVKKDIVFIGDELTADWETTGAGALAASFTGDKAMFNLGFAGDCTEHVLWRIRNGELGNPKAIFLMVGGNNTAIYTGDEEEPGQTFLGVKAIIDYIRSNHSSAKLIVQAILPRGADESDPVRARNDFVNNDLRAYSRANGCTWVDMSDLFLEDDHHVLRTSLYNADKATLNAAGYGVWAQAVAGYVDAAVNGAAMPSDLVATARPAGVPLAAYPSFATAVLERFFWEKYEYDVSAIRNKSYDIVLLGDSITQKWGSTDPSSMSGLATSVFNLGRSGDFTENLLWRLNAGCLDGYTTKFFTLLVGTNNTVQREPSMDSPADIAAGVKAALDLVLAKHPESKVLLVPILPYGSKNKPADAEKKHANNVAANEIIKTYADGQRVFLVNLDTGKFYLSDGSCNPEMYDATEAGLYYLHLSAKGYSEILAPAIKSAMASAGASSVTFPSVGSVAAKVVGTTATLTLSDVVKGTDASGAAASSYKVTYKLDTAAETTLAANETGDSATVELSDLADGWHACVVAVSADGVVRSAAKRVKFQVDTNADKVGWKVAPMTEDSAAIRNDGTKVFAIARTGGTFNGVEFSSRNNCDDGDNLSVSPANAEGGGWGLGVQNNIINNYWRWNSNGDVAFAFKGLTSGRKYLAQIVASRYHTGDGTTVSAGDLTPVLVNANNDYRYGAVITCIFEATGAQESIVVSFSNAPFEVKAVQLRDLGAGEVVPDPSGPPGEKPNWPAYGPCTPDNRYTIEGAIPVVNQLYREQLATLSDARFPLPRQFDLVTIGDSITDNWDTRDKDNYFALAGANGAVFNLGIGGDRIEQLIWRLEEGGCNNFKAKFITLLIGTNNSYQRRMEQGVSPDDPVEMAKGIERVLWNLKTGHPEAKILLMPILPYEKLHTEGAPECRANNENVNDLIIKFVDNRQVFWLDIRGGFLNADGTFRDEYWSASGESGSDGKGHYLHPSGAGYREVFDPAVRAAMAKIDATLSAGTAQETDPSLGYASASVDSWNSQVTMTLSGVYVGTDSSAVRASSYKVEYKLDDGDWTMALENQTLTRNSFAIEKVALGQHTCEIKVTTSAGKTMTTVSKFFMGDAWIAKPLGSTSASVRTDGNLVCAYANARCTVAGVAFAAAGGSIDDANIKWPFGATGGSQAPTGVESGGYSDLLTHCWWMNPGTGGGQSTVTLKGLTAGHEYLVQLFAYRSAYNDGFLYVVGTQADTTFIRAGGDGWPYGGTLVGRFTAAAETKDIVIQIEGATALNGIQVRDLGEGGYIPPTPPVDPPVEPPVEPPDDPVDPPDEPVESGWTAEPMDSVGAKFSTQGELKYAYATQGVTVNGVSFTRQITLADSDSIAFSPADCKFSGVFMNEGVSGDFGLLLGNGWFWKEDGVTARTVTLMLKNLMSGKKYLVQILSHTTWNNDLVVSAGGCTPQHVHGSDEAGGKYGALLTGVFTASATTQAVSISFSGSDGEHPINAIQVRELGEGGDDPVAPPVVRTLTIPEKTGLTLVSVTTNGVAVSGSGNAYAFFDNAQVAVTFAAASGYEIVSGNPVVITMTADRTLADGEYPVVRTTSGGDDPIKPSVAEGWTGARLGADSGSVRTDGTLVYAYAKAAYQAGEVQFAAFGNVEWATFENDDLKFYLNGNAPSASAPSGTESGGYADLLTHGWWYNGGSQVMTLKKLKAGTQYLVQVFCYRSSYNDGHVTVDGETLQGESYVTSGAGDFTYGGTIIGVFTADSTTKSITFKSTSQWCFNAVQVRELPVELPEPEAPVIGGEGVDVPFAVSSDRVSITIGNAASGVTYGYRKSTTLAGLKTAEPVWLAPAEVTGGVLVIEITKDPAEPNCFYQICVK